MGRIGHLASIRWLKRGFCVAVLAFSADAIGQNNLNLTVSGTNVQLHWFSNAACTVETSTNLVGSDEWSLLTDYAEVQIGSNEFILTYPMDASTRYFRLNPIGFADDYAVLLETTTALTLTEENPNACFDIANVGGTNSTLDYSVTSDSPWLSVSPGGSMAGGETNSVCVLADGTDLFAGATYSATVTISDGAGNILRKIPVTFVIPPATIILQAISVTASGVGQRSDTFGYYFTNWNGGNSLTIYSNFLEGVSVNYYGSDDSSYPSSGHASGSASARQTLATVMSGSCAASADASAGLVHADGDGIEEAEQGGSSFSFGFGVSHKTHFRVIGIGQEQTVRQDPGGAGVAWDVQPACSGCGYTSDLPDLSDSSTGSGQYVQNYNVLDGVLTAGQPYSFDGSAIAGGNLQRGVNFDTGDEYEYASIPGQASLDLQLELY